MDLSKKQMIKIFINTKTIKVPINLLFILLKYDY